MQNVNAEGVLQYQKKVRRLLDEALLKLSLVDASDTLTAMSLTNAANAVRRASNELYYEIVELQLQLNHEPDMPVVGEYYSIMDDNRRYVMQVTNVQDYRERNRNELSALRFDSAIDCLQISVDGKFTTESLYLTLIEWMEKWAAKTIGPVTDALIGSRDITPDDIERVKALIPFLQIPEGKYLNLDLLRRLAKNARKNAIKEAAI